MKLILTSFLLFLAFSIQAAEVTFIGKIKNPSGDAVEFLLQSADLIQEDIIYRARINENNDFSIVLPIHHPQIIRIKNGENILKIYASPKTQRLEFEFDANAPSATLVLKGQNIFNINSYSLQMCYVPKQYGFFFF